MMSDYGDHDVSLDPIIVIPCGHFYAVSTLDGHFGMSEVYTAVGADSIEYNGTRPLSHADINEKPRTCPDCRAIVHSIYRYGRIFRLSELRALEIKHCGVIEQELQFCRNLFESDSSSHDKLFARVQRLRTRILKGPTRRVFEACSTARESIAVPQPPQDSLIHSIELLGRIHAKASSEQGDENEEKALNAFKEAIALADASTSTRAGARIRLHLVAVLTKWTIPQDGQKEYALEFLDWVIEYAQHFTDMQDSARPLKQSILDDKKIIAEVMQAVSIGESYTGYNWSDHWYQCPNGHPYYIGNCGGAMQQSRCLECAAPIGGRSHQLEASNQRVGGLFAEAMTSAER